MTQPIATEPQFQNLALDGRFLSSAAAAVAIAGHHLGVSDAAQRLRLDVPLAANSVDGLPLLCSAVGLVSEPAGRQLMNLKAIDCPAIIHLAQSKRWLCLIEISAQGLGVCLDQAGKRQLLSLNDPELTRQTLEVWRLRPSVASERQSGPSAKIQRTLFSTLMPSRDVFLPIVLATIAINILALAIPLATMNILDRVIANAAFNTLYVLTIGVLISIAFDFILRSLRALVLDRASARSEVMFANLVFSKVLGAKASARKLPVGVQTNSLREIEGVREYVSAAAIATLGDLPFLVLFLAMIWVIAGATVVVPLAAVPVVLLTMLVIQWRMRKVVETGFAESANKNAIAIEILNGIETIKTAQAEGWASRMWERAVASQLRHGLANRKLASLSSNLIIVFQGLTTILVLVVGVHLVTDKQITPGALFAANMLAGRCMGPLAALAGLLSRLQQNRMAFKSVAELTNMEQERSQDRQLLFPAPLSRQISFENATFAFAPDQQPVLSNISLVLKKGERVGIIGGIGSGKSTLARLLTGFDVPLTGQISFDGIPTNHIDPQHLRRQIGIVPQTPSFFRASLRDNVALGRAGISDIDILQALTISGAQAWVSRQAKGLDSMLGEQGAGLSAGQKQTVALARAFLGSPSLLVLDEPTSNLDQQSETQFAQQLKRLPAGTSIVLITHSPPLLDAVERLIVMERGKILLDGPKAEVLQQMRGLVEKRQVQIQAQAQAQAAAPAQVPQGSSAAS